MNNINKTLSADLDSKPESRDKEEDIFETETGKSRKVFFLNAEWLVFFKNAEWLVPNSGFIASCFYCRPERLSQQILHQGGLTGKVGLNSCSRSWRRLELSSQQHFCPSRGKKIYEESQFRSSNTP